ncbi:MAG: translation initiation factor IF-2, partial [Pseudomonadota bacterium]|nr:translation initiation factor IF-2 [Pseudomonadota bacterium]
VAAKEAGGITQHIGAYQVSLTGGRKVTFLDTPGHEAFTAMRARGAKITDIVVLVVAADDGIMEQTKEAINHARAANVPIVVAINKIDKPGADAARVKNELMQFGLVSEEFGGDVIMIEVSAKTGQNLDKLIESLLLQAEILELKANPDRAAAGVVIESRLDQGKGVVATVLVQKGTLKVGDIAVAGPAYGRVRMMYDDKEQALKEAPPGMPVVILGLSQPPEAGDMFSVVEDEKTARDIAEYRARRTREHNVALSVRTVENLFGEAAGTNAKELPVIVKADVQGSVEAIAGAIMKFSGDEVAVRLLHSGVGGITESDVTLAKATGAMIIAFNVRAMPKAKEMAGRDKANIRYYSVIYDVVDDVKAALSGMLSPTLKENFLGLAEIREVFSISKAGKVAGCMVTDGIIKRGCKVRLLRDNVVIHEGTLKTLKRFKDEVKEVKAGLECGMAFENYEDIRQGDQIECFEVEEVARTV